MEKIHKDNFTDLSELYKNTLFQDIKDDSKNNVFFDGKFTIMIVFLLN